MACVREVATSSARPVPASQAEKANTYTGIAVVAISPVWEAHRAVEI